MLKVKPSLALAFKALTMGMAALSVMFVALAFTDNNLHILFLASGLFTLSPFNNGTQTKEGIRNLHQPCRF